MLLVIAMPGEAAPLGAVVVALHMRTLHPLVLGGTIVWAPDEPGEFFQFQHDANRSALLTNPVYHVVTTHEWVALRLDDRRTRWATAAKRQQSESQGRGSVCVCSGIGAQARLLRAYPD